MRNTLFVNIYLITIILSLISAGADESCDNMKKYVESMKSQRTYENEIISISCDNIFEDKIKGLILGEGRVKIKIVNLKDNLFTSGQVIFNSTTNELIFPGTVIIYDNSTKGEAHGTSIVIFLNSIKDNKFTFVRKNVTEEYGEFISSQSRSIKNSYETINGKKTNKENEPNPAMVK